MQAAKFSDIVSRASQNAPVSKEVLQSMTDFVFMETKREMAGFNVLRMNFSGLFVWFYGKKRLEILQGRIEKGIAGFDNRNPSHMKKSFIGRMDLEQLQETLVKVKKLLLDYEDYIGEKKSVKAKRNDSQYIHPTT